jgi:transcriptional regulator with XRE-family HTH domain
MQLYPDIAKIKRWREERQWSQEHLADLAGIGLRTIQRIENGDRASSDTLMALAAAFNVDVGAITIDKSAQAARQSRQEIEQKLAGFRLSLWLSLTGYIFVMAVFSAISWTDGLPGYVMKAPALWCTVAVAGHALAVIIVTLIVRFRVANEAMFQLEP